MNRLLKRFTKNHSVVSPKMFGAVRIMASEELTERSVVLGSENGAVYHVLKREDGKLDFRIFKPDVIVTGIIASIDDASAVIARELALPDTWFCAS